MLRDREVDARDYVFRSERGEKLTRNGFWRIVSEAGKRAGLPMKAYTHHLPALCRVPNYAEQVAWTDGNCFESLGFRLRSLRPGSA